MLLWLQKKIAMQSWKNNEKSWALNNNMHAVGNQCNERLVNKGTVHKRMYP